MSVELPSPAKDDAAAFRARFRASKNIIVIAGDELSAASGKLGSFASPVHLFLRLNHHDLIFLSIRTPVTTTRSLSRVGWSSY